MKTNTIRIRGASQNNLRGVDVDIPRDALVVFTGLSGSGKSSLAHDTIYRLAERRYLQSFSSYARQFVGRLARPDVARIEGLSPAISLDQRSSVPSSRSTVGTMSEIYDYLRLLFGRLGQERKPGALGDVKLAARLFSFNSDYGACPDCKGLGLEDHVDPELLVADENLTLRGGALVPTTPTGYIVYSQVTVDVLNLVCEAHGFSVDIPWKELDEEQRRVVLYGSERIRVPYGKHPLESRMKWKGITARPREEGFYKGIVPTIEGILRVSRNKNALRFARSRPCSSCGGSRLRQEARDVLVGGHAIHELTSMSLGELAERLPSLTPSGADQAVAAPILSSIRERIEILDELGLAHVSLDRPATTLAGGERNRVRLATQLCGALSGALFVLDEPSVGLHARDVDRLVNVLERLRDRGNSVLVVEHDPAVIRRADWVVDIGPAAGHGGGEVLYSGPLKDFIEQQDDGRSPTRRHLQNRTPLLGRNRRHGTGSLRIRKARARNLCDIDVELKLGAFNAVTGVSGAGKSTLVNHVLARALRAKFHGATERPGEHEAIDGVEALRKLVLVDQSPIGRTPRSNPATYTKLFDAVRGLFANEAEARRRGFDKGRFSFNTAGGRCERCEGAGVELVGMHYLPDAVVTCPVCQGRRFNADTLAVRYQDKNVHEVLGLSFDQALDFFADGRPVARIIQAVCDVGLGYLTLGQPSTTLSGGEAQRVKLAAELARPGKGHTLYVLDEFTTGLHPADVARVLTLLERLVESGNTVVVVEHDVEVLAAADHIVDLGPGSGAAGGRIVANGTPEEVAGIRNSHTGLVLAGVPSADSSCQGTGKGPGRPSEIRLTGVRTNNLRSIDARFPHEKITVVTGLSGSGKSSLAFDTLHAEGHRRYAEGLSTYARRHLVRMPRPELDTVAGLGATVAVGQSALHRNPRSTLATLTDLYDALRLLYSRAGTLADGAKTPCSEVGFRASRGDESRCLEEQPFRTILDTAHSRGDGHHSSPPCGGLKTCPRSVLTMRAFSFNHEEGACPTCRGLGTTTRCAPRKLVSHPERPLTNGAMDGHKTGRFYGEPDGQFVATLRAAGKAHGVDFERPWDEIDERARTIAMQGTGAQVYDVEWQFRRKGREGIHSFSGVWQGFAGLVDEEYERVHADRRGEAMRPLLEDLPCESCGRARLKPAPLAVLFLGKNIVDMCALSVAEALALFRSAEAENALHDHRTRSLSEEARTEITRRLSALERVGVSYLTLDRRSDTLSNGEARRAQIATLLGAGLTGVTHVLDEPTLGLHARDTAALVGVLKELRDDGNTVVVVEHDPEVIAAADHLIELGPGAGSAGGRIVAQGGLDHVLADPDSPTGRAFRRASVPLTRANRRLGAPIVVRGARANNLQNIDVSIPTGGVIAIAGVSGSGKSSLVFGALRSTAEHGRPIGCQNIEGTQELHVIAIDQRPLVGNAASMPATYLDLFTSMRKLFAATDEAKRAGITARQLSLTTKGLRCEACKGQGQTRVEMGFLADVWVPCDACGGRRFRPEALALTYRGKTLADALAIPVDEAAELFQESPAIGRPLATLAEVGLGYLRLGQPTHTLSGGEAQRLKLAAQLAGASKKKGKRLYLLDEPTVGLHMQDVFILDQLFHKLADEGHTVVVVEHDLHIIRNADWVIELGPEGGPGGGRIVREGRPREAS